MKEKVRLDEQTRNFFALITKAMLLNPFIDERAEVMIQISSDFTDDLNPRGIESRILAPVLNENIDNLEQQGLKKIQQAEKKDQMLIRDVFLLQVYLRFMQKFDELIYKQITLGDTAADVLFAEQIISDLKNRGLSLKDCLHYLSLFYQFRRAFHFIDRALVGDSPSMKKLRLYLWDNVFTSDMRTYDQILWNRMEDFSTILLGETGTGKGSAATAIGRSGFIPFDDRKLRFTHNFTETFIAINLSQYPESLIESELFGHRKGAFTGAVEDHKGLFERCSTYGSLFLDEIGDLSIPIQIKLLQVLQERTFTPVGSHLNKRFEGRVIAATNQSIRRLRSQDKFRDDFFYRLCSDIIIVPSLRQRIQELPSELEQMVNLLVTRMAGQESPHLTDKIIETLNRDLPSNYDWPGNVRELEQAVRRILLSRHYHVKQMEKAPDLEETLAQKMRSGSIKAKELVSQYCAFLYEQFGTYEEVARCTGLDRRTVKKYLSDILSK